MLQTDILQSLQTQLRPGQVFTDAASLITYEIDAGLDRGTPDALVFPESTQDVTRIVSWAAQHQVPLIARGAGTGLSGGAVAEHGGIIIEFSRMHAILDLDQHGRTAILQPAVVNLALDEHVRAHGLYFPPDPASQRASTIGGNVAENSGGPHCFKYGVTSNYVLGLDVVLADGRSMRIGGLAMDYPAYDLCGLITGSEGTLAIITSIFVRLVRNPPAVKTMMAAFDSLEQAGSAVSAIIAAGLVPATMEMMNRNMLRIVEEYVHAGLPTNAGAVLIIEVDGYPASLNNQVNEITHLLQTHNAYNLRIAANTEERDKIWYARKSAAGALSRLAPSYYLVDITVPRSLLAETLAEVDAICDHYQLQAGHVFHAGDGNLHPLILIMNPHDPQLVATVHHAGREMIELCIRKDGSITGEHGVGIEKRQYMPLMFSDAELCAMQDIKRIFDPINLLNPGKIFPDGDGELPKDGGRPQESPLHSAPLLMPTRGITSSTEAAATPPLWRHLDLSKNPTGVSPILTPSSSEEAASMFKILSSTHTSVLVRADVSCPSPIYRRPADAAILSTASLAGIKTFAPDDLYITAGAGTRLADIQSFLSSRGMQVPLATPWPPTTIGGLIATNINGPLRMRYGSIRDLLICASVVLPDGRQIRAGRPVIKNVAGYDLVKVFAGSHGTLGLITDATLKLTHLPRSRRTLLVPLDDLRRALQLSTQLLPQALVASAILICKNCTIPGAPATPFTLVYTAEGLPEDVESELDQIRQRLQAAEVKSATPIEIENPPGTDIWASLLSNAPQESLQLRIGVAAKDLPIYMQNQAATLDTAAYIIDVASGHIHAVTTLDGSDAARRWLEQLRRPALELGGYAVVISMPQGWRDALDPWGYHPQALDLMRALKARWDPVGILNPGAFIV